MSYTGERVPTEDDLSQHQQAVEEVLLKGGDLAAVLLKQPGSWRIFYSLVECPECHEFSCVKGVTWDSYLKALVSLDYRGQDGSHNALLLEQYPPPKGLLADAVPVDLSEVLRELDEDYSRGRNKARILAGCRSLLDRSLLELDGGSRQKNRIERIQSLAESGKITNDIAEWAKKLWVDGHDGVHELRDPGHPIEEHIAFLKIFFEVVFVVPAKVAAARRG